MHTRESLSELGLDYQPINVTENHQAQRCLRTLDQHVTAVVIGDRGIEVVHIADVDEFIGCTYESPNRLSPAGLYTRFNRVLATTKCYIHQVPWKSSLSTFRIVTTTSARSRIIYFHPEKLREAAYELCRGSGSPEEANLVSGRLIKSNLTGHPSHGVMRLSMYMKMIRRDMIKPGAIPEFMQDHGSTAVINGNRSYGQVAAEKTMSVAIERGLAHGIAAVDVTNLSHIGRLADYATSAARKNCIGLVFASGGGAGSLVAPFEGNSRRMATNPLAMSVPPDRESPIIFDMATSVWAEGKFRVLRASGRPAPENTLIDKEGKPTTNPRDFYEGGAIFPLGGSQGYKVYLLNFMIEVLAGLLTGAGCIGAVENPIFNNCTMMMAINVDRFRELPLFKMELEKMITYLKEYPVVEGKEVLYPGEVEVRLEKEICRTGIPLPVRNVESLQEEMDRYAVALKLKEIGSPAPFI